MQAIIYGWVNLCMEGFKVWKLIAKYIDALFGNPDGILF